MLGIAKTKNINVIKTAFMQQIKIMRLDSVFNDYLVLQTAYLEAIRYAKNNKNLTNYNEPYINLINVNNQKLKEINDDDLIYDTTENDKYEIEGFWLELIHNLSDKYKKNDRKFYKEFFKSNNIEKYRYHLYFQEKLWDFFGRFDFFDIDRYIVVHIIFPFLYTFYQYTNESVIIKCDVDIILRSYLVEVNLVKKEKYELAAKKRTFSRFIFKPFIYFILISILIAYALR